MCIVGTIECYEIVECVMLILRIFMLKIFAWMDFLQFSSIKSKSKETYSNCDREILFILF